MIQFDQINPVTGLATCLRAIRLDRVDAGTDLARKVKCITTTLLVRLRYIQQVLTSRVTEGDVGKKEM